MASSSSSNGGGRGPNRRRVVRSRCFCGDLVGKWTSWTPLNPGRRFVGCPNFQDEEHNCNYFGWVDGPLPDQWYRDMLLQFHNNGGVLNPQLFGDFMHHEPVEQVQERPEVIQEAAVMERADGLQEAGGSWKIWFLVVLAVIVVIMCVEV